MIVVVTGTISDGFTIFAPFEDYEEAAEFAENECQFEWWVTEAEDPKEDA